MQLLIIEDELPAQKVLQDHVAELLPQAEIAAVLGSVKEARQYLIGQPAPDLIFLDIHLSDGYAWELFPYINDKLPVIFTTAYDAYALRAFELFSLDYLLKPIRPERLAKALQRFQQMQQQPQEAPREFWQQHMQKRAEEHYKKRFLVKLGSKMISVSEEQIAYFQRSELVYLCTIDGKRFPLNQSLDELQEQLDPQHFFRLNRKFIVHIQSIEAVHQHFNGKLKIQLRPAADEEVMVSREKATAFKDWLGDA